MVANHQWDEAKIDAALASLAVHDTTPERAGRIRARALGSRADSHRPPHRRAEAAWRRLEPVAALAAGAAYMSVVLRFAMALYG